MANDINLMKALNIHEYTIAKTSMADLNNLLLQMGKNPAIYKAVFDKLDKGENLTSEDVRQLVAGMKYLSGVMKEAMKKDPKAGKIANGAYSAKQVASTVKQMDKLCTKLEKKFL